jgi:hypothetical protein
MSDLLTLAQAAKIIDQPPIDWMGACYAVSCKLAVSGVLPNAVAVYGAYLGPVAEGSMFETHKPFQRHGWVLYGNGELLDPTRWVFENVVPYLYWSTASNEDYDEGNNSIRRAFMRPAPKYNPHEKRFPLGKHVTETVWRPIAEMLEEVRDRPDRTICLSELFWLANLPLDVLGELAHPLFKAFKALDKEVAVPIDNYRRVMEGRWPGHMHGADASTKASPRKKSA